MGVCVCERERERERDRKSYLSRENMDIMKDVLGEYGVHLV